MVTKGRISRHHPGDSENLGKVLHTLFYRADGGTEESMERLIGTETCHPCHRTDQSKNLKANIDHDIRSQQQMLVRLGEPVQSKVRLKLLDEP